MPPDQKFNHFNEPADFFLFFDIFAEGSFQSIGSEVLGFTRS